MGQVKIKIVGSFANTKPRTTGRTAFSAMEHGHAAALGEAIAHLTSLLPAAIDLDHRLQATGDAPLNGFGQPAPVSVSVPTEGNRW